MLSTEIAALTGKRHDHVMRDIRVIIEQLEDYPDLGSGFKSSTYLSGNGKQEKCYELDYDATMIVMTGYDVVARELYLDLGLMNNKWARWSETNIVENNFFSVNADFIELPFVGSEKTHGNFAKDYAVTIEFAKHIAMMSKTQRVHNPKMDDIEIKGISVILDNCGVSALLIASSLSQ